MQEGPGQNGVVGNGTPEQGVQMMQDGFGPGGPGQGMMNMNMAGDFGMQVSFVFFSTSIPFISRRSIGPKPNGSTYVFRNAASTAAATTR